MATLEKLDIHLERLVGQLCGASLDQRSCLERAIKRVERAREVLFRAHQDKEAARAQVAMAEAAVRRVKAETARLKGDLQIIRRSPSS